MKISEIGDKKNMEFNKLNVPAKSWFVYEGCNDLHYLHSWSGSNGNTANVYYISENGFMSEILFFSGDKGMGDVTIVDPDSINITYKKA